MRKDLKGVDLNTSRVGKVGMQKQFAWHALASKSGTKSHSIQSGTGAKSGRQGQGIKHHRVQKCVSAKWVYSEQKRHWSTPKGIHLAMKKTIKILIDIAAARSCGLLLRRYHIAQQEQEDAQQEKQKQHKKGVENLKNPAD